MTAEALFFTGRWRRLINTAAAEKGSIHDDDAAARLGFRGGFVPGSVVGTAAMPAIVAAFGSQWMEGGWYSFTFVSPVYVNDDVREVAARAGDSIHLQVVDRSGRLCCNGEAGLGTRLPWDASQDGTGDTEVLPGIQIGHTFKPIEFEPQTAECVGTVTSAGDETPWYREQSPWGGPLVPPEYLHVVALHLVSGPEQPHTPRPVGVRGPGMWATHDLVVHAPLLAGDKYTMREKVADKGRSGRTVFLTYEFEVFSGTRLVAHGRHKAKWLAEDAG